MMDLVARVRAGFGWVLGSTLVSRLLQLIGLAITTRLLAPEEFGLLAVVNAVVVAAERFTNFGLEGALVQLREVDSRSLDVAWSYQLARNFTIGLLVIVSSPWLAECFHQPEAAPLVRFAALLFILNGFRSIGLVQLRRQLNFRVLSYLEVIQVVFQAVASICLVWYLQSVWGLIIAAVLGAAAGAALSYGFAPHRPRLNFSWQTAKPLFRFGMFLLGNTVLQTLREQGIVFVVARMLSREELGFYNRGFAFSYALLSQLQTVFWRVALPSMSTLQDDPRLLRAAWRKSTGWMAAAAVAGGVILLLLTPFAVRSVLGEIWLPIVPLVQVFIGCGMMVMATAPSEVLIQATGRPGLGTAILLLGTVVMLVAGPWMIGRIGLIGAAAAFLVSTIVMTPLYIATARAFYAAADFDEA